MGVCEAPYVGEGPSESVEGRRGVALPRSTQAPCSIRSVSVGPQFLPQVTFPSLLLPPGFGTSAYY